MNKSCLLGALCTCVLAFFHQPTSATIISGEVTGGGSFDLGGTFINLSVPFTESNPDNTVGDDNFQNQNLYGFDEAQNTLIVSDLSVDILADGLGGSSGSGVIAADTTVASHYIFFDPNANRTQIGTVSFDANILGILTSTTTLANSDYLANTGVNYLNPTLRGLESGDVVSISGLNSITVDWFAGTPGDYIRVLTEFSAAAVPIPPAVWLFSSGLLGLIGISRRKKSA